jgi:hypothetical protein
MKKTLVALLLILPALAAAEPRVWKATHLQTLTYADSSVDPPVGGVAIDGDSIILIVGNDAWLYRRASNGTWSRSGTLWHVDGDAGYRQVAMKNSIAIVKLGDTARIWEKVAGQWVPSSTAAPISGGGGLAISARRILVGSADCGAHAYLYEKNSAGKWDVMGRIPADGTCPPSQRYFDLNYDTVVMSDATNPTRTYHRNGSALDWVRTGDVPSNGFLPALQNDTVVLNDLSYYRRNGTSWNPAGRLRPLDYVRGTGSFGVPRYRDGVVIVSDAPNDAADTWEPYVYMKNAQGGFDHVGVALIGKYTDTFDVSGNTLVTVEQEFHGDIYTNVSVYELPADRYRPRAIANNFDARDISGFTPSAGSQYSLAGNSSNYLYRQSDAFGDTSSVIASSDWTDYQSIEADLKPNAFSRADSWIGLTVRHVDADNYYFVSLGRDQVARLQRKLDGVVTTLGQSTAPISVGAWTHLRLVADAAGVRVLGLPGVSLGSADKTLKHGRAGVLTSGARADFDNVVARSTEGFVVFRESPPSYGGRRDFSYVGGHWTLSTSLQDRGIKQDDTSGQALAVYGPTLEDESVKSFVRLDGFASSNPVAWYGVLARYVDPNNYYYLSARSSGTLQIRRVVNGVITVLKAVNYTPTPGEKHWLQLNVIGNELTALVDDAVVARAVDDQIPRGRAGIGTYRAAATFDTFAADQL